jgi:hypothetical protein
MAQINPICFQAGFSAVFAACFVHCLLIKMMTKHVTVGCPIFSQAMLMCSRASLDIPYQKEGNPGMRIHDFNHAIKIGYGNQSMNLITTTDII